MPPNDLDDGSVASSFQKFADYYEMTGRVQAGRYCKVPPKPLNSKQIRTAYESHLRKIKRLLEKRRREEEASEGSEDRKLRVLVEYRDGPSCRLLRVLTEWERAVFGANANYLQMKIDAAHVFGKNAYPHMRYTLANIVMLNRVSHTWIDAGKSPITGKPIAEEEKRRWWERILGKWEYEQLEDLSRRRDDN
jgi:hypothetical protein